ncbi:hypothetical protein LPJGGPFB_02530 [Ensifer adhaerens]|uniref:hypothetical protein n=1 Tax=Ensifer adhaerens TaxID=106592 RepID=UPI001567D4AF|nr:hypothetical protein [Ensifer adhaerens]NRP19275.1 hypothetical protein [Ensifer adhaerens]
MWEYVNGIGSIVGLITGAFVIWERFLRYTPSAFLIAQPYIPGGAQKGAYLRIINRSERPIIVRWPTGMKDHTLSIARDHSTRSIIRTILEGDLATAIDGSSEHLFPVHTPNNFPEIPNDGTMSIEVSWRFAQPLIYKHDRTLKVSISKEAYRVLLDLEDGDMD